MVLCDLRAGGAEVSALELLRALGPMGYHFTVAAIKDVGVLGEAFVRAGAELHAPIARWRLDPLAPLRIRKLIRSRDIEAMIVIDAPRNAMFHGFLGAALAGRKIPRICWCKSVPGGQAGRFDRQLRAYWAAGLIDVIVCTSRLQRGRLLAAGLARRGMALLRNGVDLGRFACPPASGLPLPPGLRRAQSRGKRIIIQVANLMPDKDFATLLSAAALLAETRDDFHLVLLGRDTDSLQIRRDVGVAGLRGRVTLAGHRDDVPSLLAAADVFVLSTRSEVFSVSTLEAMAAGLPVIVSDIDAFDEMLTG
ncbi:MAG: glycosyltransferase, partial [Phycisphaerae bacterium]|nr:glycosyltransferase [Phycisphaerae bacterium]